MCVNHDCVNGGCIATKYIQCYRYCPFKMDSEQQQEKAEKANERLRRLSPIAQQEIAAKYYNGLMPWKA